MALITKPVNLSLTWASGGDVLNPGDTKYATGWQVEIPPRQWFNYLDNRQDTALAHINQHGVVVWDATTEYQEDKSYVQGTTNGTIYRCIQTHTNQNPELDVGNVYWIIAFASAGDFYTKAEADGIYLAKTQNLADLANTATARTNLSVYSQAQTYTKVEVDAKTTVASTAQAQAGTSNTTLVTPLRLTEWSQSRVIGINQTWQNMNASRLIGTTYTNTSGKAIFVLINFSDVTSVGCTLVLDGVTTGALDIGTTQRQQISFIVPNNGTYLVTASANILNWLELR